MNKSRFLLNLIVIAMMFCSVVFAEGMISATAKGEESTPEQKAKWKAEQKKIIESIDLDISIKVEPVKSGKGSFKIGNGVSGSGASSFGMSNGVFELPDGKLHHIYYSDSSKGIQSLRMVFIKNDGNEESWHTKPDKPGFEFVKGARLFFGEKEFNAICKKIENGENAYITIDDLMIFRDIAKFGDKAPLQPAQKDKLQKVIQKRKDLILKLYDTYLRCKQKKTDSNIKKVFDTFNELEKDKKNMFILKNTLYTPLQRMMLRSGIMKHGSASGFWEDQMGSLTFSNSKGKFTASVKIYPNKAGAYLEHFIKKVCGKSLGKQVSCSIDKRLADKTIKGKVSFRSVKGGLDKIAKLAGGKLEKKDGKKYSIVSE